jgi:hypothetical protein
MVHAMRLRVLASGTETVDKEQRVKWGRNYCRGGRALYGVKPLFLFGKPLFGLLFFEGGSCAGDHLIHVVAAF